MEWTQKISRHYIKMHILKDKLLEYKCSECGIFEWNSKAITLHLDHIDGIKDNNKLSNLRFLCPNCHSQTSTYCGKNNSQRYSSKTKKISDEILLESMLKHNTVKDVLNNVGLSGANNYNRVYKLAKKHNIDKFVSKSDKIKQIEIEQKKKKLLEASIDISKYGWIQLASECIEISPQHTRQWIERNFPEYLSNAKCRTKS